MAEKLIIWYEEINEALRQQGRSATEIENFWKKIPANVTQKRSVGRRSITSGEGFIKNFINYGPDNMLYARQVGAGLISKIVFFINTALQEFELQKHVITPRAYISNLSSSLTENDLEKYPDTTGISEIDTDAAKLNSARNYFNDKNISPVNRASHAQLFEQILAAMKGNDIFTLADPVSGTELVIVMRPVVDGSPKPML